MAQQFDYGLDKRIIDVSFAANWLLFIRTNFYWTSEDSPPNTVCNVKGLPWDTFNFFDAPNTEDADFNDPTGKIDTKIVNPVSTGMLQKYNQFVLKDPVRDLKSKTIPGIDTAEITYANWIPVFKGHETSRLIGGTSRADATEKAIALFKSEGEDATPENTGVILERYLANDGHFYDVPNYPDPIFIKVFAGHGWSYTVIPGKPGFARTLINDAVLHINLAKVKKLLPASNGKKPKDFTFKVFHPDKTGPTPSKSIMTVQAALYKTSVARPPAKADPAKDGRLDYKFIDKLMPAGPDYPEPTTEHLYPEWSPWPLNGSPSGQTGSSGGGEFKLFDGTASKFVEVKVTFAAAKEPAKVDLSGGTASSEG